MTIWNYCDCGSIVDEFEKVCSNCGEEVILSWEADDVERLITDDNQTKTGHRGNS